MFAPTKYRSAARIVVCVMLLLVVMQSVALACPTCKDSLDQNDPARSNMVRGYFWSILFMMSMPFLILGGLGLLFYSEVRKARARQADEPPIQQGEATASGAG